MIQRSKKNSIINENTSKLANAGVKPEFINTTEIGLVRRYGCIKKTATAATFNYSIYSGLSFLDCLHFKVDGPGVQCNVIII